MQQKLDEFEGKYIIFKLADEQKPKTFVYDILTKEKIIESGVTPHPTLLGVIKYYANWNKYAFFPEGDRVFEETCLTDILDFMRKLMEERKKELKDRTKRL